MNFWGYAAATYHIETRESGRKRLGDINLFDGYLNKWAEKLQDRRERDQRVARRSAGGEEPTFYEESAR